MTTRDEVLAMAEQAGLQDHVDVRLMRFHALAVAKERDDAERYRAVRKKDFEEAKNHHFNFTGYPFERSEHDYNKEYDLIADRARSAK